MYKLIAPIFISLFLFACSGNNSGTDNSLDPPNSNTSHTGEEETLEKTKHTITNTIKLDVSESSEASFLIVNEVDVDILHAYFPEAKSTKCTKNPMSTYNLEEHAQALYFHKIKNDILEINKLDTIDIADLGSTYKLANLGSLDDSVGAELVYYMQSGANDDVPIIYGESDVRDNKISNTAFGINLKVQDAYLVYHEEDDGAESKSLYLYHTAKDNYAICTNIPNTSEKLLLFNCALNSANSRLYTKCGKNQ